MRGKSSLSLENYIVKEIHFSINEDFHYEKGRQIEINPIFGRSIHKLDEDYALVDLSFDVDKNENIPFSISIVVEGKFKLGNWETPENINLMSVNALAILFPFLRSVVTSVTANANIIPYIIPVMNINAMFREDQ